MLSVFDQNINVLRFRLHHASHKKLVESFVETFNAINIYRPKNELENTHLLEVSRCFIDEIKKRVDVYVRNRKYDGIAELAGICQGLLKNCNMEVSEEHTPYMLNNLIRIYAYCIKVLKKIVPKDIIKKEYL